VHHVMVGVRRQGLPAHTAVLPDQAPGSARCELEVLSCARMALGPAARALGWPEAAWEALLVLRTGRTHQVGEAFWVFLVSLFICNVPLPSLAGSLSSLLTSLSCILLCCPCLVTSLRMHMRCRPIGTGSYCCIRFDEWLGSLPQCPISGSYEYGGKCAEAGALLARRSARSSQP
jgi:hypothetical protein